MKGILLISHGPLAEGMLKTTEIFFKENIPQMGAITLGADEDPETFRERLHQASAQIDDGDGVVVLADLFGGTPCNQTAYLLKENWIVLTGMNLAMVMECLTMRMSDNIDAQQLQMIGKEAIIDFKQRLDEKRNKKNSR